MKLKNKLFILFLFILFIFLFNCNCFGFDGIYIENRDTLVPITINGVEYNLSFANNTPTTIYRAFIYHYLDDIDYIVISTNPNSFIIPTSSSGFYRMNDNSIFFEGVIYLENNRYFTGTVSCIGSGGGPIVQFYNFSYDKVYCGDLPISNGITTFYEGGDNLFFTPTPPTPTENYTLYIDDQNLRNRFKFDFDIPLIREDTKFYCFLDTYTRNNYNSVTAKFIIYTVSTPEDYDYTDYENYLYYDSYSNKLWFPRWLLFAEV